MSNEIDNKIVSMQFDNAVFERKLGETIASLDKLRITIDGVSKTKGLNELTKQAGKVDFSKSQESFGRFAGDVKKFNMDPVTNSAAGVSKSFVAMATIAITALASVTAAAVQAGGNVAKAFVISPITDGFKEFETNMGSIQTILANTDRYGTTLDEVTAALDELNRYSDKTIYNFGDMVKNIGLFTNAGIRIEDATAMIQGFSNVAAASGTNAQGAASAAYQLSQALSAGKVTLMDWKSLQNVGMGNKNMQLALVDLAEAMGTLGPAGISATEIQKNFNGSLEKGWLSADVMSNYLKIMAGDMDEAGMAALGLSDDQIAAFSRQQRIAEEAATKVRTFSQLIGTVKESIGSGWSETFRTVIGGFNESTELFTGINNRISEFVGKQAEARNQLLAGWKAFGGRDALIQGFKDLVNSVSAIIAPIRLAFRQLVPKTSVESLLKMTKAFGDWAKRIKPGEESMKKIYTVAKGFFDALAIGWTIVKESAKALKDLFDSVTDGGSRVADAGVGIAEFISGLKESLVDGEGIRNFFQKLSKLFAGIINVGRELFNVVTSLFGAIGGGEKATGRVEDRFGGLTSVLRGAGGAIEWVVDKLGKLADFLGKVREKVAEFADKIKTKFNEMMSAGNFSGFWDVFNAGLVAGFLVVLKKLSDSFQNLTRDGLKFTHAFTAEGGLVDNISETFGELTGVLKSMQLQIKSKALLNIAIAVAVLTASLLVLSMIDSKKLAKALGAIGVAFGQLIAVMTALDHLVSSAGAAGKLAVLGLALIGVAVAVGILSFAIKSLAELQWDELARGLAGTAGALLAMVGAVKLMGDPGKTLGAAISMIAMATALVILAKAVEAFGEMKWDVMKQGLLGVSIGLAAIVLALNFMPPGSVMQGLGIVVVAAGLLLLSKAVESFGNMDWDVMKQGLIGVGIALAGIALAMWAMPPGLPITALGLIGVAYAVGLIAGVIETIGEMKFEVVRQGLLGMGAALLILAAGAWAMQSALPGAAAMVVMAGALTILSEILVTLGSMKTGDIVKGLLALAGIFAVLGLAALLLQPVVPAMLGLAGAVALIGGAIALFGVGVYLIAKGLEMLAKSGEAAAKALVNMLKIILSAAEEWAGYLIEIILNVADELLDGLPPIIDNVGKILSLLLDKIIELLPKVQEAMSLLISGMLDTIRENGPKMITVFVELLDSLVQALAAHSESIAQGLADLISGALDGLASRAGEMVTSLIGFFVSIFEALAERVDEVAGAYLGFWTALLGSITENIDDVVTAFVGVFIAVFEAIGESAADLVSAFVGMIVSIIEAIGEANQELVDAFVDVVVGFIEGAAANTEKISGAVTTLVTAIGEAIKTAAADAVGLIEAGRIAIETFATGLDQNLPAICRAAGRIMGRLIMCIPEAFGALIGVAVSTIVTFVGGLGSRIGDVLAKGREIAGNVLGGIAERFGELVSQGRSVVGKVMTGIGEFLGTLKTKAAEIGSNIIQGIKNGINDGWDALTSWLGDKAGGLLDIVKNPLGIFSPSREMYKIGEFFTQGLADGIKESWAEPIVAADTMSRKLLGNVETNMGKFKQALDISALAMSEIGGFDPVIRPVLDLSAIREGAKSLGDILSTTVVSPQTSYQQARLIAHTTDEAAQAAAVAASEKGSGDIYFQQTVNSPRALNTAAMYRQSKSLVARAKEELKIP